MCCTGGIFHREVIITNFTTYSHWQKFYLQIFFSCVKDYILCIATFAVSAKKKISLKNYSNTKVARLSENFIFPAKSFVIMVVMATYRVS